MPCFHAFWDRKASCGAVWAAMLSSLALITYLWMWIVMASVYLIQNPPGKIAAACPGSGIWPVLALALACTLLATVGGMRLVLDAQSGATPPGAHWPRRRKVNLLAAACAALIALWVAAGATSLSPCARAELSGNHARQTLAVWFYVNAGAGGSAALACGVARALETRKERLDGEAREEYVRSREGGAAISLNARGAV